MCKELVKDFFDTEPYVTDLKVWEISEGYWGVIRKVDRTARLHLRMQELSMMNSILGVPDDLSYSEMWLNGYVIVLNQKLDFGMSWGDYLVNEKEIKGVHGGITFGETFGKHSIVGFDTAHAGDNEKDYQPEYIEENIMRLYDGIKAIIEKPTELREGRGRNDRD